MPTLDRTRACARANQFEGSLLEQLLKAISRMIKRPLALERTRDLILISYILVINYDSISLF